MKVLVTGSAGFIGSSLSIALLIKGFRVIGIDNHHIPIIKKIDFLSEALDSLVNISR